MFTIQPLSSSLMERWGIGQNSSELESPSLPTQWFQNPPKHIVETVDVISEVSPPGRSHGPGQRFSILITGDRS